ncbi:DNA polymerase III subunit gamma/tau [Denitromonas iodatirespirans]|uniref:DNA polymerase III subunit gamma/tau n=1 Tax=Denitromonas iodatirespirans TaxID=2795389 RepID=A0A944H6Y4_DENI1|nr:DNA polymerase III subunit gamma/tau [Denitromonas iodatirespirans]MBT0960638.1 DNA polymerase III subunit gamma/tau [Denitromonas iodatirespirans]
MSYQVLARKWRPKSFDTLVGQEHVVRALTHALETGRLHHAYLFTGTRGVGKTTIARILAKALNCETGVTPTPCGVCSSCQEIDSGRFVDLLEVDAATNTRVDEMRQLLENAVYAPTRGRFKVYVIDEVHMLSNSAFNAMLKTLEEPPEHIKFILATTDPQKIPVTVLSRCLQFNLKQMPPGHIVEHLSRILETENIPFDAPALRHIAKGASGSMRDALSLLDQAIAHGAGQVEEAGVQAMLGSVGEDHLYAILDGLVAGDVSAILQVAEAMDARSLSFDAALQALASLLQRIAVFQFAPTAIADEVEQARLQPYVEAFDPEFLQLAYQIAIHGRDELPLAPDEPAGFVMTLLRLHAFRPVQAAPLVGGGSAPMPRVAEKTAAASPAPVRAAATAMAAAPVARTPVAAAAAAPVVPVVQETAAPPAPDLAPASVAARGDVPPWEDLPEEAHARSEDRPLSGDEPPLDTVEVAAEPSVPEPKPTSAPVRAAAVVPSGDVDWHGLIVELGLKGMVRELAQHCEWLGMAEGSIRLRLSEAHRHLIAMNRGNRERLQAEIDRHFDRPVKLDIEIGGIEGETPAQRDAATRQARLAQAIASLEQDPFVQEMIERFDATLQEASVRPL